MWRIENNICCDNKFPFRNLVTTKKSGNLRDVKERKRFCASQGIGFGSLTTAEQVHGTKIAVVDKTNKGLEIAGADGLITAAAGIPIAIFTADCMPIFLAARKKQVIGLIHAGWRGLHKGIIEEAVKIFRKQFKVSAKDITASIGPHIQECCYTVSDDLKKIFGLRKNKKCLSLSSVAVKKLKMLGIKNISVSGSCSFHQPGMFHSYRREKTDKRMMSLSVIDDK